MKGKKIAQILSLVLATIILLNAAPDIFCLKADSNELPDALVNASFETGDRSGWKNGGEAFSVVSAKEVGLTAPDGTMILKSDNTKQWNYLEQVIKLKDNTEYEFSFWVYRVDSSSVAWFTITNQGSSNVIVQDRWLNNEAPGKWEHKVVNFNSENMGTFRLHFKAYSGSATYFDDIQLKEKTYPDNFVNPSFESGDRTGWKNGGEAFSVVTAEDVGLTAPEGAQILKSDNTKQWNYLEQTVKLKQNTDYEFSFWVYRVDNTSVSWFTLNDPESKEYIVKDRWLNNETPQTWEKKTVEFNSGNKKALTLHFKAYSGSVTYFDDIKLTEKTYPDALVNASFETSDRSGWKNGGEAFSVISAEEVGLTAPEGTNILKSDNTKQWNYIEQTVKLEQNTDYQFSFWVYRVDSSSVSWFTLNDPESKEYIIKDRWLNNEAPGEWVKKVENFNSGDMKALTIHFKAYSGSYTYIDDVRLGKTCSISVKPGENGKVEQTEIKSTQGDTVNLVALPNKGYMVEGWYINGEKVSSENEYQHTVQENVEIEVKFAVSNKPIMTAFNTSKVYCNEQDNLIKDCDFESDSGIWNCDTFVVNDILDVVESNQEKVLYFNPDGNGRQVVYFPIELKGNTEYMFSANVKGEYYSNNNHLDMSFGIMTPNGKYIYIENLVDGSVYNEIPNLSETKCMTPPTWDNEWHRRGMTFKIGEDTTVWIAISGDLSKAYFDDFMLCELDKAYELKNEKSTAKVTNSYAIINNKYGCKDNHNLIQNYNFNLLEKEWNDGFGWNGLFSGLYIGNSGAENKSLFMRSTTGRADNHMYIKWIDVKPDTDYTVSLAAATSNEDSSFGLLAQGTKYYEVLVDWTAESDSIWQYFASDINSGNSEKIGLFVVSKDRTIAIDEVRFFESANGIELKDKLSGEADLPDKRVVDLEVIEPTEQVKDKVTEESLSTDEEVFFEDVYDDYTEELYEEDSSEETTQTIKKIKKVVRVKKKNKQNDNNLIWIIIGVSSGLALIGGIFTTALVLKKRRKSAKL